jgi:hypothetical protein
MVATSTTNAHLYQRCSFYQRNRKLPLLWGENVFFLTLASILKGNLHHFGRNGKCLSLWCEISFHCEGVSFKLWKMRKDLHFWRDKQCKVTDIFNSGLRPEVIAPRRRDRARVCIDFPRTHAHRSESNKSPVYLVSGARYKKVFKFFSAWPTFRTSSALQLCRI